jgi:copper chaperone CopZ
MTYRQQLLSTLVLGALVLGGASIGLGAPQESGASMTLAQAQSTQVQSTTIPIEGMACMLCVGRVKKTLKSLDGVLEVTVSLEHRNAHVRYLATQVSPENLVKTIDGLGYTAGTPVVESTP